MSRWQRWIRICGRRSKRSCRRRLRHRRPALLVTHNMEEAYRLGEELLVLSRGRVAAIGPKKEIFRHPPSAKWRS